MLPAQHFAGSLAIGTFVGPGIIDVGVAPGDLTVTKYQHATNFSDDSIEQTAANE